MSIVNLPENVRTMTFTLSDETLINFANSYDSVAIRSDKEVGVSEFANKQMGDNGVLKCNAGDSVVYLNLANKKQVYIIGESGATVEIFVGNGLTLNPFKSGGKGGGRIENPLNYLGVTTTALSDGSTTNPIIINSEEVTAENDDWVIYQSKDFIFNGTVWQEVGDFENYYTKSETDTLLSVKANSADVYTKTQSDNTFVAKSDIDIKETPTTSEINESITNIWGVN